MFRYRLNFLGQFVCFFFFIYLSAGTDVAVTSCSHCNVEDNTGLVQQALSALEVGRRVSADFLELAVEESAVEQLESEGLQRQMLERGRVFCEGAFWHTLNTCVQPMDDDTVNVVTGDIDAMWLRDSSAQMWPYLLFAARHKDGPDADHRELSKRLQNIIKGTLRRQAKYISTDPYANAFNPNWGKARNRRLNRGGYVFTGNFEVDSGAYFFRLLTKYMDLFPSDLELVREPPFQDATRLMVSTYRDERDHFQLSDYRYPRKPPWELPGKDGMGNPVNKTGMVWGAFRPSDDAQIWGYNIPDNIFLAATLGPLAKLADHVWKDPKFVEDIRELRSTILEGVQKFGTFKKESGAVAYCYEVDGLGNCEKMDDANVPSLLSLPYLDPEAATFDMSIYRETQNFIWSTDNKWYFEGKLGKGIGSPHTGTTMIWPMSLVMMLFASHDKKIKQEAFETLLHKLEEHKSLMESFSNNQPGRITRHWFGWPNSLFAEYMMAQGMCDPDIRDVQFPNTRRAPYPAFYKDPAAMLMRRNVIVPRGVGKAARPVKTTPPTARGHNYYYFDNSTKVAAADQDVDEEEMGRGEDDEEEEQQEEAMKEDEARASAAVAAAAAGASMPVEPSLPAELAVPAAQVNHRYRHHHHHRHRHRHNSLSSIGQEVSTWYARMVEGEPKPTVAELKKRAVAISIEERRMERELQAVRHLEEAINKEIVDEEQGMPAYGMDV